MGERTSVLLGGRGGRPRRWLVGFIVALTLSTLAGCSAGRSSLGTSSGPCYVALPTAVEAVGSGAHLDGVRLWKVRSLNYRLFKAALQAAGVDSGQVCLVAFTGSFSSSTVTDWSGRTTGRLAVVVLRYPGGSLVATVLFHHLPTHFGHTHFG